jgi:hypothetical protein
LKECHFLRRHSGLRGAAAKKRYVADVLVSPYAWDPIDPGKAGEKKVLYGVCRHCMQGDCATHVHIMYIAKTQRTTQK